ATFVVVNPSTKFDKLSYIVGNCQASGLVTTSQVVAQGTVAKLRHNNPQLELVVVTGAAAEDPADDVQYIISFNSIQETYPAARPTIASIDLDLACLVYTSGSTGEPKGVMCDHSNVVFVANSVITYLENTPEDILLNVLPLSFGYGLYQLLMTF